MKFPLNLFGIWTRGVTIGLHSKTQYERTELGDLVYRFKYCYDKNALNELANISAETIQQLITNKILITSHGIKPFFDNKIEAIIPIPPSDLTRKQQPVYELAKIIGNKLNIPVDTNFLIKLKSTSALKNIENRYDRDNILRDTFKVAHQNYKGKSILLFDDLYRSGSTLHWASWSLFLEGGLANIYCLTLTKTTYRR